MVRLHCPTPRPTRKNKWVVQNGVKVFILHIDNNADSLGSVLIYRYQSLSVSVSGSVSTPLDSKEGYQRSHLTNLKALPRAANEYAPIFKAFP